MILIKFKCILISILKGPLTYNDNGKETLVGVVSWSKKDNSSSLGKDKLPVYTRVTATMEAIFL